MAKINLTDTLRADYQRLFDSCQTRAERAAEVEKLVNRLLANQPRYMAVAERLALPWQLVAVIHNMEAGQDFNKHLHNGDPLSARTTHVPAGRPRNGNPPFSWEDSAADALLLRKLDKWQDWSVPGMLYQIEGYNGWGYRLYHPHVLSPYLWSGSQLYSNGKYVADGSWSDSAVSQQCGAVVLLRRLAERNQLQAAPYGAPPMLAAANARAPMLRYSPNREIAGGRELQRFLNQFPDIYLKEDGKPGERTSNAFRELTGHYLQGDPRA